MIRAHLLAVEDDPNDEGQALLKIRAIADGSVSHHAVPAGAVIVSICVNIYLLLASACLLLAMHVYRHMSVICHGEE